MLEIGRVEDLRMKLLLAGDIGGTNTRLRLAPIDNWRDHQWEATYSSQEFTDLTPIVQKFLAAAPTTGQVITACFAVAGQIEGRTASLTNLGWNLDTDKLIAALGIANMRLINDFAAIGYGIEHLQPAEIHTLQAGQLINSAPRGLIGAGTGLGEGYLIPQAQTYQVLASEGGHSDFAARHAQEFQLVEYLMQRDQLDHISCERIVSGTGIVNIYQFLRDQQPSDTELTAIAEAVSKWEQTAASARPHLVDPAMLIAQSALAATNQLATATMQMFLRAYGAEAGNLALKFLPQGGLYIAGGIAVKNLELIKNGTFITAFLQKGRMKKLLTHIPVHVILNTQVGLIGAAAQARAAVSQ
jgi:glucokinase